VNGERKKAGFSAGHARKSVCFDERLDERERVGNT